MATMKAVRIHEYGGPEVLQYEDAPRPEPKMGEVLVRVRAASVNPIDWKIRAGHLKNVRPLPFPFILGWDVSGTVESVGRGVTKFSPGDEVFGYLNTQRPGSYAEYVLAEEGALVPKPASLDHLHAAAIPLAGLTAYHGLFEEGHLKAGQRVLVHGAAGGVGSYAVQLAKWKGAYVTATASGRNRELLKELGVNEPIDYTSVPFEKVVQDADLVFDTIGGETQVKSYGVLVRHKMPFSLLAKGRLVSTVGVVDPQKAEEAGIEARSFMNHVDNDALRQLGQLAEEGTLKVIVETVLPLSEARKAHELSQSGHTRGKIVLTP